MHCFNLKVKQCFNLTADLTRQLLENGKIAGVSTRSRGDTHQPESVCAFLYEPDVLIFGKFIVKRFFYLFAEEKWKFMQYWPVRAVVVVNTVVKVGKLVDAEPLVDRVVLVLQARLEKKRISRRNLEAWIKTETYHSLDAVPVIVAGMSGAAFFVWHRGCVPSKAEVFEAPGVIINYCCSCYFPSFVPSIWNTIIVAVMMIVINVIIISPCLFQTVLIPFAVSVLREYCSFSHFPSFSVLCHRRFDL